MTCPDIDALLDTTARSELGAHLESCEACAALVTLAEERAERVEGRDDACAAAEVTLALGRVGALAPDARARLGAHLEECRACGEVALRLGALPADEITVVRAATPAPRAARASRAVALGVLAVAAMIALAFGATRWARRAPAPETRAEPPVLAEQPGSYATNNVSKNPAPSASVPVAPERPMGFLSITCAPGCRVLEGGRLLGRAPLTGVALSEGVHELELSDGAQRKSLSVTILAGQATSRHVEMVPGAKSKHELGDQDGVVDPWSASNAKPGQATDLVNPFADRVGYLSLMCVPGCDSVRDGTRELGPSPVVRAALTPGAHQLTLRRGTRTKALTARITAGQTTALRINMDDKALDYGY